MDKLAKHKKAVLHFLATYHREPTYLDFNENKKLPHSRTIQRTYGGLISFRKLLGLKITDYTKGEARSKLSKNLSQTNKKEELEFYKIMVKKYGRENVLKQPYLFSESAHRADIGLYKDDYFYLIDIFNPKTVDSFKGCVRVKNNKLKDKTVDMYPGLKIRHIFVCMNNGLHGTYVKTPHSIVFYFQFKKDFLD